MAWNLMQNWSCMDWTNANQNQQLKQGLFTVPRFDPTILLRKWNIFYQSYIIVSMKCADEHFLDHSMYAPTKSVLNATK